MSRGFGDTQRAALTLLADAAERNEGIYLADFADELGVSRQQAHRLVKRLVAAGLAHTDLRYWTPEQGVEGRWVSAPKKWSGSREIGWLRDESVPATPFRWDFAMWKAGDPFPYLPADPDDERAKWFVRQIMPTRGLLVFLGPKPERQATVVQETVDRMFRIPDSL